MHRPFIKPERLLSSVSDFLGLQNVGVDAYITGLASMSTEVEEGDLFLGFPGAKFHGARFSDEAAKRGARAVLTDAEGAAFVSTLPVLIVPHPRQSAGPLSSWFYDEPMRDLFAVGVTGTNGKTTTTPYFVKFGSLIIVKVV